MVGFKFEDETKKTCLRKKKENPDDTILDKEGVNFEE